MRGLKSREALASRLWRRRGSCHSQEDGLDELQVVSLLDWVSGWPQAKKKTKEDSLWPWVAREISKASGVVDSLYHKGGAIAQWAKAEHVDIMRLDAQDVLGALGEFDVEEPGGTGHVAFYLSNGRTAVELDWTAGHLA